MDTGAFLLIALFVLAFGLISERLQRTVITAPMVFVAFGVLIGPQALGWWTLHIDDGVVHLIAELTLVLVLFTDASRIDLKQLRTGYGFPLRLLLIGMPLTIVAGTVAAAFLFEEFTLIEAALLAAILAPTDAALGQIVVSSPRVPVRVRQALNVESGLNDGIALPLVMILAAVASMSEASGEGGWVGYTVRQLALAPVVGIGVGLIGGRLVSLGVRTKWMNHSFEQLAGLSLAFAAFAGAEVIGGNGFIAAFLAGLTIGNTARPICTCLVEFTESEGQLLTLLAFLLFGTAMVPPLFEHIGWDGVVYAVLSLTVIRMAPVAMAFVGTTSRLPTRLFMGWFGPRGLASILFVLLIIEHDDLDAAEPIATVALFTVLLSVVAHGVSALPAVGRYAGFISRLQTEDPESCELCDAPELPVRHKVTDPN